MKGSKSLNLDVVERLLQGKLYQGLELLAGMWGSGPFSRPVYLSPVYREFTGDEIFSSKSTAISCEYRYSKRHDFVLRFPDQDLFPVLSLMYASLSLLQDSVFSFEILSIRGRLTILFSVPHKVSLAQFMAIFRSHVPDSDMEILDHNPLKSLLELQSFSLYDVYMPSPYFGKLFCPEEYPDYPLRSLLDMLSHTEFGIYQVLLQPITGAWVSNTERLLNSASYLKHRSPFHVKTIRQVKIYDNKPLFAVCIRILCAKEHDLYVRSFLGSFHWNNSQLKYRTLADYKGFSDKKILAMICYRLSYSLGSFINCIELAKLTCLPAFSGRWNLEAPPPQIPTELLAKGRPLGVFVHLNKKIQVNMPDTSGNATMHLIGNSRYGKSTTLKNLMLYHILRKESVVFVDPHGDAAHELAGSVPQEYLDSVIYFTPAADDGSVFAYNIFDAADQKDYGKLTSDLLSTFQRMFDTGLGHRAMNILGKAVFGLFVLKRNLADLPQILSNSAQGKKLRAEIIAKASNREVKRFFTEEFPQYRPNEIAPVLNKFSNLFLDEDVLNMFSVRKNQLDMREILDTGKTLICSLSVGLVGSEIASLLGSLIVAQIQKTALRRASVPVTQRKRAFVFIDEFHRLPALFSGILESYVNELRKYGVFVCLANQELNQLSQTMAQTVLSIENRLVYNSGPKDCRELSEVLGGSVKAKDIARLGVGEAYCKIGLAEPVKLRLFPPQKHSTKVAEMVKRNSFSKYYVRPEHKTVVRKVYDFD